MDSKLTNIFQISVPIDLMVNTSKTFISAESLSGKKCSVQQIKQKGQKKEMKNNGGRVKEERSQRLSRSHSPEVPEVREECFQGLQPHPTCALLRMLQNTQIRQMGHVSAQAHQSTLTSCPCHVEGIFPLDRPLNHL